MTWTRIKLAILKWLLMNLKLPSHKKHCEKCGSLNIRVRWHLDNFAYGDRKHRCEMYDYCQQAGEHLHLYCDDCLYNWAEKIKKGVK